MMHARPQRGFTLLIAVILASVILALALALIDVAYKQIILASTAKNSQYAFYAADNVLECILYYDQKYDAFGTNPNNIHSISCNGANINFSSSGSSPKLTSITLTCGSAGTELGRAEIYKGYTSDPPTRIYVTGYSSCNTSDARRIERGIRVLY